MLRHKFNPEDHPDQAYSSLKAAQRKLQQETLGGQLKRSNDVALKGYQKVTQLFKEALKAGWVADEQMCSTVYGK